MRRARWKTAHDGTFVVVAAVEMTAAATVVDVVETEVAAAEEAGNPSKFESKRPRQTRLFAYPHVSRQFTHLWLIMRS